MPQTLWTDHSGVRISGISLAERIEEVCVWGGACKWWLWWVKHRSGRAHCPPSVLTSHASPAPLCPDLSCFLPLPPPPPRPAGHPSRVWCRGHQVDQRREGGRRRALPGCVCGGVGVGGAGLFVCGCGGVCVGCVLACVWVSVWGVCSPVCGCLCVGCALACVWGSRGEGAAMRVGVWGGRV